MKLALRSAAFLMMALLIGCAKESGTDETVNTLEVARSVTVAQVELRQIASRFVASGVLVSRELASVSSELSGYVVSELHYEAGDTVSAGDTLVTLDDELLLARILQVEAVLEQAKAQAKQAMVDVKRVDSLAGRGLISDEKVQLQRTQVLVAQANVKQVQAELNGLLIQKNKLLVTAPASGLILERKVNLGDVINAGQALFSIAQAGLIEVDAEIPEQSLMHVEVGQTVSVRLSSGLVLEGVVRLISPQIDPLTKLGRARVSLPLNKSVRVGGFAQVIFQTSTNPVLVVPEKAIQFESNGPSVIVVDHNQRAKRVLVKTVGRSNGFVVIESEVKQGSWVALGGGAFLLDGDKVKPIKVSSPSSAFKAEE